MAVTIHGTRALQVKLARMARSAAKRGLDASGAAGAQVVTELAQENAPRREGALARSLQARPAGGSLVQRTYSVGSDLPYARIQEFGGTIVGSPYLYFEGDDGALRRVEQVSLPGQPYLRPAADEGAAQAFVAAGAMFHRFVIAPVVIGR